LALDLAAGREERFGLAREAVRALEALLGRFLAETRFFIFLVPLDLDLLLDLFPGIESSWVGDVSEGFRGGIVIAYGVPIKVASETRERIVPLPRELQYLGRPSRKMDSSMPAGSARFSKRRNAGFPWK
jgi:hypothetical protein